MALISNKIIFMSSGEEKISEETNVGSQINTDKQMCRNENLMNCSLLYVVKLLLTGVYFET